MKTDKINSGALITLLPVISVLTVILAGIIKATSGMEIAKVSILTLILTSACVFFIRMQKENILNKKYDKGILIISYLISITLILLPIKPDVFCFWMAGGLVVAMLIDQKLGLIIFFNLSFILGVTQSLRPEETIHFLVMGLLMVLLSGFLKQKSTAVYAGLILISTNVTLAFVVNNFIFESRAGYDYVSSSLSIFAILSAAFLLSVLYGRFVLKESTAKETIDSAAAVTCESTVSSVYEEKADQSVKEFIILDGISDKTDENSVKLSAAEILSEDNKASVGVKEVIESDDQSMLRKPQEPGLNQTSDGDISYQEEKRLREADLPAGTAYHNESRTSYEILIQTDNSLMNRVKGYSQDLYEHLIKIGDISMRAAHLIGADEILAKAGGLYHEIGKINGKNYIEESLKLADEYSFPKELKVILRQHNIKYDKPTSIEAAIVMLSDNIVSTIDYIKKTGDNKYNADTIIDNIFKMRMEKGTFDESGLTVKDFKILKEFYQKEYDTINK